MALRKTASGLLIPVRMNEQPTHRCNFPGCDWVGYNDREQVAHVKEHVRESEDEIVEMTTPTLDKILGPGDVERQEWLERRYRQLVKEVGPKEALNPDRY